MVDKQKEYITFGSLPLLKHIKTLSYDGILSIDIHASLEKKKELTTKDSINIRYAIIWNSKLQDQNIYRKYTLFHFEVKQFLNTIRNKQIQESILKSLSDSQQNAYKLSFEFSYCRIDLSFFAGKVLMTLVEAFENVNLAQFHIDISDFKIILDTMDYFYDKYIDIHNYMFSKYTSEYTWNEVFRTTKKIDLLLDLNKQFIEKFDNIINTFSISVNKLQKMILEINEDNIVKIAKDKVKNIDNKDINKPKEIKDKTLLLENDNISTNKTNELQKEDTKEIKAQTFSDLFNTNDINQEENSLSNLFQEYFKDKEDEIKAKRPEFLKTDIDEIKNPEIKEKLEKQKELQEQSKESKTLSLDLLKYQSVDEIRTKIRLWPMKLETFEDMILDFLNDINGGYLFKYLKNNSEYDKFNKMMTFIINYYKKKASIFGYKNMTDPLFYFKLDNHDWINDKDLYLVLGYIYIIMIYFNSLKDLLVSQNIDPLSGIKDDRSVTSYIKLTIGSFFNTFFNDSQFNIDLLKDGIISALSKINHIFDCDLTVKNLQMYDPEFINKFKQVNIYMDSLINLIKLKQKINEDYGDDYVKFFKDRAIASYKLKESHIDLLLNDLNQNINDLINDVIAMKPILMLMIEKTANDTPFFNNLLKLLDRITDSYKEISQYPELYKNIRWEDLNEDLLKAIILYEPTKDIRLVTDYNYYQQKIKDCSLTKQECLQLLYSCLDEQNNNKVGNRFIDQL